ncbi:MAG TPA: methyltransferase domain-containing protein [Vicinamibacterales bacterium]|nr:methyltransferase domain-containing protein [Vicinamibacterales bacterium]
MLKLRKTAPREPLIVAMTAIRMADRLLVIGCANPKLVAQLAIRPGLSGRACAVDEAADRTARAAAAAEREGALLEVETGPVTSLPFGADSFDVVVVSHLLPELTADRRVAALHETARVLRSGGRCVVVQAGRRRGLGTLLGGAPPMAAAEIESAMQSAGFRAVRTIADRGGLAFVEGARR